MLLRKKYEIFYELCIMLQTGGEFSSYFLGKNHGGSALKITPRVSCFQGTTLDLRRYMWRRTKYFDYVIIYVLITVVDYFEWKTIC